MDNIELSGEEESIKVYEQMIASIDTVVDEDGTEHKIEKGTFEEWLETKK